MSEEHKVWVYSLQVLFVSSICFGSQTFRLEDLHKWGGDVARYAIYLLLIKGSNELFHLGYKYFTTNQQPDFWRIFEKSKRYLVIFAASTALVVYLKQTVLKGDFIFLFIGYLVAKYPEMEEKPTMVNYGTGMALSYIEGYLVHVIPSDGGDLVGIDGNLTAFEAAHGIVFPVKRLFIVITKSLYCPPDLKDFNKPNRNDLPFLEARQSLQDVKKDVAGVKNRTYRNSVYKISRPGAAPVSLAAECATPLHTLHRVIERRMLYEHLANVDLQQVVTDFCNTLQTIIDKCPDYKGKCVLVYYDDTDPSQNLADVLIDKIREIEPDFENIRRN